MAYKCAVCGKSYDTFHERAACESACIEKMAKDEAARKKENQEKIKKELTSKIREKIDETTELIKTYKEVTGEEPELTTTYTYSVDGSEKQLSKEVEKELGDVLKEIRIPGLLRWLF